MSITYQFDEVGRLPLPGDNVAITTRRLEVGTTVIYQGTPLTLDQTILEGHRFAIQQIQPGEPLLSWELPFGVATKTIEPGTYVINDSAPMPSVIAHLILRCPPRPTLPTTCIPMN
ncbi:MAG: SAF domain-containing protein [Caldilineaceae bacterium]